MIKKINIKTFILFILMSSKNLSYSLIEKDETLPENGENVTYENLLKQVNEDAEKATSNEPDYSWDMSDYIAAELNYKENFTKKQLEKIADYYQISKRKKKKDELIEEIVIFEKDIENRDITGRRKTLWFYMEEIKNDNYLSKFLILD